MPYSMPAEQALLGSILIDPDVFNDITGKVSETDFYLEEHRQIFLAMRELFLASKDIDATLLVDRLVTLGVYDKSGGIDYIQNLAMKVPTSVNAGDYANIVREKSLLRAVIEACGEISDVAMEEQEPVQHVLDMAESKISAIAQGHANKNFDKIADVIQDVYGTLDLLKNAPEQVAGVKIGFEGLDRTLAGIGKSDLVLIGARPGMGKTSFALNIASNVAQATGKAVAIFSLEMSSEQLVTRMLSSEALIDSYKFRTGELDSDDWIGLAEAASRLAKCNILIDDTTGETVTSMKAKLRRVNNLGMIVIDYLQLMTSDRKIDNRVQEVGDISRNLKIMAKELGAPVLCCAQLSRGPEGRTDKKPMLSDLRDSGAIEQDADSVMFLYRSEYYDTSGEVDGQDASVAEVIIAKNRHGSTGSVKVGWNGRFTKFVSLADNKTPGA